MTAPTPRLPLPLADLTVVALEQAVTGPYCTRQLADFGARVIKIERPDGGDMARHYDGALHGVSAYFAWLNRGKESVVLDLKTEPGRSALHQLVARADIFVHNLVPGAVERLGLGYDRCHDMAPRLIWVAISGYGPDGPYRDKKAYDMLIQAEAGVVSLTGTPEAPAKVGISIADIAAGHYAFSSTLVALRHRDRTGRGERIDISMLECLTEWVTPQLSVQLGTGVAPARAGLRHNMIVPYGAYRCADGSVMFATQSDREWKRFCAAVLRLPAIAEDPRFATNPDRLANRLELERLIEAILGTLTVAVVVERLDEGGIANAVVNDMAALAAHPQLAARNRWTEVETPQGSVPALRPPHNLSSIAPAMAPVPGLGADSARVLAELD
ncbi:MAG: CoA transferase [Gemmatimonadetes bacterium]|nr:CoA transferase [Gemmatimonadota bacterium]